MCWAVTPYQCVTTRMNARVHTHNINREREAERGWKFGPQVNEPVRCSEPSRILLLLCNTGYKVSCCVKSSSVAESSILFSRRDISHYYMLIRAIVYHAGLSLQSAGGICEFVFTRLRNRVHVNDPLNCMPDFVSSPFSLFSCLSAFKVSSRHIS